MQSAPKDALFSWLGGGGLGGGGESGGAGVMKSSIEQDFLLRSKKQLSPEQQQLLGMIGFFGTFPQEITRQALRYLTLGEVVLLSCSCKFLNLQRLMTPLALWIIACNDDGVSGEELGGGRKSRAWVRQKPKLEQKLLCRQPFGPHLFAVVHTPRTMAPMQESGCLPLLCLHGVKMVRLYQDRTREELENQARYWESLVYTPLREGASAAATGLPIGIRSFFTTAVGRRSLLLHLAKNVLRGDDPVAGGPGKCCLWRSPHPVLESKAPPTPEEKQHKGAYDGSWHGKEDGAFRGAIEGRVLRPKGWGAVHLMDFGQDLEGEARFLKEQAEMPQQRGRVPLSCRKCFVQSETGQELVGTLRLFKDNNDEDNVEQQNEEAEIEWDDGDVWVRDKPIEWSFPQRGLGVQRMMACLFPHYVLLPEIPVELFRLQNGQVGRKVISVCQNPRCVNVQHLRLEPNDDAPVGRTYWVATREEF